MTAPLLESSYQQLPKDFYRKQLPTPLHKPVKVAVNEPLAEFLGIDLGWLNSEEGIATLAGNSPLDSSTPIACAYGGHQFGSWNPGLGDGRAILLGEIVTKTNQRFDIQLKGSGQTPFSRSGDGRSPLGPVLREYLVSEAMHALKIPTTRSLTAIASDDYVFRESPLRAGILTRVASSHIRVGTFQLAMAKGDLSALKALADHVIARHFPEIADSTNPYLELLRNATRKQANLISKWQLVGFIHGVMNTDNMLVCGETVDYGPCAFMDAYLEKTCYSAIDQGGRYDYRNQPAIGQWNLSWLAQSLLPLIDDNREMAIEVANDLLSDFVEEYQALYQNGLMDKLGLNNENPDHQTLGEAFLSLMATHKPDYTLTLRELTRLADPTQDQRKSLIELPEAFETWIENWRKAVIPGRAEAMKTLNPMVIPRNHRIEEAIAAAYKGDFSIFHRLCRATQQPYAENDEFQDLTTPPKEDEVVDNTFCGT